MKLTVRVKAKSSSANVVKESETTYSVSTPKAPENNQANKDVVRLLADHFSVAPSRVQILAGERARVKIIEIL